MAMQYLNAHLDACVGVVKETTTTATTKRARLVEPTMSMEQQLDNEKTDTSNVASVSIATPKKQQSAAAVDVNTPLAARIRPEALSEFVGQTSVVQLLQQLVDRNALPSFILWGPSGSGKTTLAKIISKCAVGAKLVIKSAVSTKLEDLRSVFTAAKSLRALTGQRTILFIDEVHRFNKLVQDSLLPEVEDGLLLIGATTENPSFSVNAALLSRCTVLILKPLLPDELLRILRRALEKTASTAFVDESGESAIVSISGGDARVLLNTLEACLSARQGDAGVVDEALVKRVVASTQANFSGEVHYDSISALHKSIRGSDANAALVYLARCLHGGDPLYIARRLIRMASEDIGDGDHQALGVAVAAWDACKNIGMPEAEVSLAHCVVYLARARKSVVIYEAWNRAKAAVSETPNFDIPMHLRNAPTRLMKEVGYGRGYVYTPHNPTAAQEFLPEQFRGKNFFEAVISSSSSGAGTTKRDRDESTEWNC
jgi:putative ATPase